MTKRKLSQAAIDRAQSEVAMPDPEGLARYKAAHGGLTPIEYALSKFPTAAESVAKHFPHLLPKIHRGR